jgi:hypothetical protein
VLAASIPIFAAAQAQTPEAVALVLEVAGGTDPAVAPFSELRAGTKLSLGAGSRLRFVHYKSCRMVAVRGGELTLLPSGHLLRGGATESDEIRACPKRLAAGARSGVAGGLVMRGASAATIQLSPQPTLMIAGARAARFADVSLESGGRRVALDRAGTAPVWRYAGPLLAPGAYRLVATAKTGETVMDEAVTVVASDRQPPETTILRAD